MKKEQMVGTRLPVTVVRDLEAIEEVEQSDRSTTVRKLLSRAIQDWKLDHYSRLYSNGKLTLARAARGAGVSLWEMMDCVKTKKITAQYDLEDLQRDLKTVAASEER
jgi:predicted HTH domain antitoxin